MKKEESAALLALAAVVVITIAWWALALWPVPGETPVWLARTRAVCFNATPSGLPDASGWLLLIGEPVGMVLALLVVWRRSVLGGLRKSLALRWGRVVLSLVVVMLVVGAGAAYARVASARAPAVAAAAPQAPALERLDVPAPELGLIDQRGAVLELSALGGRPALITFAFGHCETVCPVVVHDAVDAVARVPELDAAVVVVSLDPWRDTPSRLPHIAGTWELGEHGHLLSGEPDAVNAVLDAWDVTRSRDLRTGDIVHPALVYVLDRAGRIAHATAGGADLLAELLRQL